MFSEDEYFALVDYNNYLASQKQKKGFWETGFGKGLSNIWNWASTNPDQAAALVTKKNTDIDPLKAGYVGGNITGYPTPQNGGGNNGNDNNNVLLIILGLVVVVVLFFMFKNQ